MNRKRTDDEVTRLLKDADRDLDKGLIGSDLAKPGVWGNGCARNPARFKNDV